MVRRGDIFYVAGLQTTGSEQSGTRPGIIVSNDIGNIHAPVVEVVYTTTQRKRLLPTHVPLKSLPRPCIALCEQITTVSKRRLERYIGRLADEEIESINKALQVSLEIGKKGGKEGMNELKVTGKQKFMGLEIPVVLGGFGESKKCISDKTVAEIHNQAEREIRRRVSDNIKRFTENVDYIDLKQRVGESHTLELLLNLGYAKQSITQAEHIYILSERGYVKLIKIMDTDLAWEIHDKLMDEYFELREGKKLSALEQLKLQGQALLEVDEKIDSVKEDLQQFKMDMPILGIEIDKITSAVKRRGVAVLGGKESAAYHDKSVRARVYGDIYKELKRQFGVATYKAIKRNECDDAVSVVEAYEVPLVLGKEISTLNEDAGKYEFDDLLE